MRTIIFIRIIRICQKESTFVSLTLTSASLSMQIQVARRTQITITNFNQASANKLNPFVHYSWVGESVKRVSTLRGLIDSHTQTTMTNEQLKQARSVMIEAERMLEFWRNELFAAEQSTVIQAIEQVNAKMLSASNELSIIREAILKDAKESV